MDSKQENPLGLTSAQRLRMLVRFMGVWILLQFLIALMVRVAWPSIFEMKELARVAVVGAFVTGLSLLLTVLDARSFRRQMLSQRKP